MPARRMTAGLLVAWLTSALWVGQAAAQPPGFGGFGGPGGPPPPAREAAPVDLTGTWVSLVTEDWIERMSPDSPASGSGGGFGFGGGRGGGGGPAPAVSSDPCAAYGAGGIMRVPGRIRIEWQDENTLLLDYDQGSQRRVFHFGDTLAATVLSLQGHSSARWQGGAVGRGGRGRGGPQAGFGAPTDGRGGAAATRWGSLEVVTTNLSGGYLLTSKSWYGEGATLTESIYRHSSFGNEYFTVVAVIEENGATTSTTSSTFIRESNDSQFEPTACEIVPSGS